MYPAPPVTCMLMFLSFGKSRMASQVTRCCTRMRSLSGTPGVSPRKAGNAACSCVDAPVTALHHAASYPPVSSFLEDVVINARGLLDRRANHPTVFCLVIKKLEMIIDVKKDFPEI